MNYIILLSIITLVQWTKNFMFTELKLKLHFSTKLELPGDVHEKSLSSAL